MNPNDFRSPEAGQVILTQNGYHAFIPAPLLPNLIWPLQLISALSEAERDLSRLAALTGAFPFPRLLIQPFMRREAALSSRMRAHARHWQSSTLMKLPSYPFLRQEMMCAKFIITSQPWIMGWKN